MRTTGIIAGSLGLTLVIGLLALVGLAAGALLVATAPAGLLPPERIRAAVDAQADALAFCARDLSRPGALTASLVVVGGSAVRVHVVEHDLPTPAAQCVASRLAALPYPDGRGAARVPVRVEPWKR